MVTWDSQVLFLRRLENSSMPLNALEKIAKMLENALKTRSRNLSDCAKVKLQKFGKNNYKGENVDFWHLGTSCPTKTQRMFLWLILFSATCKIKKKVGVMPGPRFGRP